VWMLGRARATRVAGNLVTLRRTRPEKTLPSRLPLRLRRKKARQGKEAQEGADVRAGMCVRACAVVDRWWHLLQDRSRCVSRVRRAMSRGTGP
jgi:hypothetical protein